ncbi:MAG: hypothetical protein ACREFO_05950 [Acetobacteraceae bacterium]
MSDDVPDRIWAVEKRVDAHDRRIGQLEVDMGEIRGYLGRTATKADVADMGGRIMAAINGLLRDALNAMPARQAAIWGAVVAIATIGMLAAALLPR